MEKQENMILIDWFSMTSKIHSPENFIALLGLQDVAWEETKGANGYQSRLYYDHISIHFNGREDMGIWLEMSGQGCRVFESRGHGDYNILFREWLENEDEMNVTRIDIAFDDHEGLLNIKQLVKDTQELGDDNKPIEFVSKFKKRDVIWSHDDGGAPALTVQHGRKGSETMIRIYDKAAERGFTDRHWIRVELQLRQDRAGEFVHELLARKSDVGLLFRGVIYNYLRYVEPDDFDSNRWRWPCKDYWEKLLDGIGRIRLYKKPGTDYNMINLENFVIGQAGNAIDTYIRIKGECSFMEALKSRPNKNLKPEYRRLIKDSEKGWVSEFTP